MNGTSSLLNKRTLYSTITTFLLGAAWARSESGSTNYLSSAVPTLVQAPKGIWEGDVGHGFARGAESIGVSLGAGYGVKIFGTEAEHNLTLVSLSYGYMLGPIQAENHWYKGNWELRGEFFSGAQFSPSSEWLVGAAPHFRYNFITDTRWVPYLDIGAGVSATSIGAPDLSRYFQFNVQAAGGVRYFICDNVAVGAEARYIHLSCASINNPNLGVNEVMGFAGVSWFF